MFSFADFYFSNSLLQRTRSRSKSASCKPRRLRDNWECLISTLIRKRLIEHPASTLSLLQYTLQHIVYILTYIYIYTSSIGA